MKKPEKKELGSRKLKMTWYAGGYNQACDDWEKWLDEVLIKTKSEIFSLPTEEEIRDSEVRG